MPVVQTRRLKVAEHIDFNQPAFSSENAHVLRFNFGEGQQIYIPSQSGMNLPAGAVESSARIATNGLGAVTEDAGVQSNIARIGGTSVTLADVGYDLATRFAEKLAAGVGTRHKVVEIFSQHPKAPWSEDNLLYTFIQENYENAKEGKRKVLTLKDVSRETARTIFERQEWTLVQSVGVDDMSIHVSAGDDDDFRFERGADDNLYPNENIGYMRFGKDGEIWSYTSRVKAGENWYRYIVKDRGCFDTQPQSFTIDSDAPVENNQSVAEHIYYAEDVRDAMLMATIGRTRDARYPPDHWTPKAPEMLISIGSITSSRFDHLVEIEEPPEQEAKAFYEKYLLSTMSDSVMRVNRRGQLVLQPIDPSPPNAAASVVFDESNIDISSLSPLKVKQDGLANPIIALWDYNALTQDFQNRVIERDLIAEGTHGLSESKTIELPAFRSGSHSGSQVQQKLVSASERYSHPTATISFEAVTSMRWVNVGALVRLKCPPGVVIDDSTGEATDLDRTFLVIGRRYNPSTRKIRYFLWGTSGKAVERSNSQLTSHIPDSEYRRGAINLADVLTINSGVLSGIHSLAPAKYYYEGDLRLAPDFYCTFTRRGKKLQLCVLGALTIQSPNPFEAKGMGLHKGGLGAKTGQRIAQGGEPGYFGRSVGGGGFDTVVQVTRGPQVQENVLIYTFAGYEITPIQGVTSAPSQTESVPYFDLTLHGDQFSGIPSDLSGAGGAGGGPVWNYDSGKVGKAAEANTELLGPANTPAVPVETFELAGRDGAYGGLGIEFWSRGGGWDGAGGINTSGGDATGGLGASYLGLSAAPPGRSMPGAFVWIQDDPRELLPDMSSSRVSAYTGEVSEEGELSGLDPFIRLEAAGATLTHGYHAPPPRQNLASTAARAMYSPVPAVLARRPSSTDLAFENQRDNLIVLKTYDGVNLPSDGNPGDLAVSATDLAGSSRSPASAHVMSNGFTWQPFGWFTDARRTAYLNLLQSNRDNQGTRYFNKVDRPAAGTFGEGDLWKQKGSPYTWTLLESGPPDELFAVDNGQVTDNRFRDSELTDFFMGGDDWRIKSNIYELPMFASAAQTISLSLTITEVTFSGGITEAAETEYPLAAVSGLQVVVYSESSAELTFDQPGNSEGITGYEIYLDGVLATTVPASGPYSYLKNDFGASAQHSYVLRAVSATSRGPDSAPFTFTTDGTAGSGGNALDPVTNLRAEIYSQTALELFWDAPASPGVGNGYEIIRNGTLIDTLSDGITTNSFFDSGLMSGTSYDYAVRVVEIGSTAAQRSDDVPVTATTSGAV